MVDGPSPLIPLLIAGILGLLLYGPAIPNVVVFVSVPETTPVSFVLIIPFVTLLAVYFVSSALIIPLILLLGCLLVSRTLMGPLILLVLIHALSVYFPATTQKVVSLREQPNRETYECERNGFQPTIQAASLREPPNVDRCPGDTNGFRPPMGEETNFARYEGDRNGWGWGFVWMFLLFLVLYRIFYDGEDSEWGFAWLLLVYLVLYNLC